MSWHAYLRLRCWAYLPHNATRCCVVCPQYRRLALGAACNQAVMLVTDVVPENEAEVFALHNWREVAGKTHARVFTFLVGRVEAEEREAKWMACANMGEW